MSDAKPVRRVVFLSPFDFSPPELGGLVTVAYRAGPEVHTVTRLCAKQAIAAGKARAAKRDEGR